MGHTHCPLPTRAAVEVDGGAVDHTTQGAVKGVDLCVETWVALGAVEWATSGLLAKT